MRKDHRPYPLKKAYLKFEKFYAEHFLRPHFDAFGKGHRFMRPWNVEVFGAPITLGNFATVVASPDKRVRFSIWSEWDGCDGIRIGNYCLICPGVRISAAAGVRIGDSCMMANGVYITDSDWHDLYDRAATGKAVPVRIENNVWLGDSCIVCKGVHIGENSIVGAGAVVVNSIPPNTVAAGNPARVVKQLDPDRPLRTRAHWYADPHTLNRQFQDWDRAVMAGNSLWGWLRYLLMPKKGD